MSNIPLTSFNTYGENTNSNNKELFYSNNMLKNIIENIPVGISVTDLDFNIVLWNSVQEKITKIPRSNVIGKNMFNTFPKMFSKRTRSRIKNILKSDDSLNLNSIPFYRNSDDNIIMYLNITINTLKGENGDIQGLMFTTEDWTKVENISDNLNENKETLKAIFNSTAEGIIVVDTEYKVINYNKNVRKILKISNGFLKNNSILDYMFKKVKKPEITKHKINEIFNSKDKDFQILELKDGRILEKYSSPLIKNNTIIGRVFSFRDITKQKSDENLLKESENYYRKLIEFLPAATFLHIGGKIIFANTAMAKLIGMNSPEELVDINIFSFIAPDFHDIVKKRIELVQRYSQCAPLMEEKFIRVDGSEVDVQVTSAIFSYKGITCSLSVVQDISECKKAEELREKIVENNKLLCEAREFDKIKTEFFANISHELRTPLNVILGALQLLMSSRNVELSKEKSTGYLNSIKQNCFRLLRLVNNLIDITKMDSGYFEIHSSNHNIVSVVEDISLSVVPYVENKLINLIFDTDIEEKIISCDPDKIERIILNLISNSIKFTNPGGNIFINIYDRDTSVFISVKDTGIGIPEDKMSIIFERFRQVDKSLTRNHEGSGIGLSLVKSLVEMHRGEISVKSTYGEGSEFIIRLPVVLAEDDKSIVLNNTHTVTSVERINIEFSDIYS